MDDRLARIEHSIEALAQGLSHLTHTLDRHGAMLAQILEAATRKPPRSEIAPALRRLADSLTAVRDDLASLPQRVADAVRDD